MLYIIGTLEEQKGNSLFVFLESSTESFFTGNKEVLKELVEAHKLQIKKYREEMTYIQGQTLV